jgi:hypothetical protein
MRTIVCLAFVLMFCGCQQPTTVIQPQPQRDPRTQIIVIPQNQAPPKQVCPGPSPGGVHVEVNRTCPHHHCSPDKCPQNCPSRRGIDIQIR